MRIVYIIESLVNKGGTERIITEKANYLSDCYGYEVYVITCTQFVEEPNAYKLSDSVKQINLSIPYYSQYRYKYPKRLWVKYSLQSKIKKELTTTIQKINPDILIGTAHFKANIISTIKCQAKKIIECHEARYFTQSGLGQHQNLYSRLYLKLYRNIYLRTIEKNADSIVTLTTGDKKLWGKTKHVEVIPNFSTMTIQKYSKCDSKRVIAVGRLGWEKGYQRLLDIWKLVIDNHTEWQLVIFGEGELESDLKSHIEKNNIKNVIIHKNTDDISIEYGNSSICVMTSYFEGFALVLLEAQRHGVPCIAFDCPFGPGSIIQNDKCGFLIENGDTNLFAEKLSILMENEKLRKQFSSAARERAEFFSVDLIMCHWKQLFESLDNKEL